jgi:hypothetical protein
MSLHRFQPSRRHSQAFGYGSYGVTCSGSPEVCSGYTDAERDKYMTKMLGYWNAYNAARASYNVWASLPVNNKNRLGKAKAAAALKTAQETYDAYVLRHPELALALGLKATTARTVTPTTTTTSSTTTPPTVVYSPSVTGGYDPTVAPTVKTGASPTTEPTVQTDEEVTYYPPDSGVSFEVQGEAAGLSTGMKVGLGLGAGVAALGALYYFMRK